MNRRLCFAGVNGFFAVAFAAFGAHALSAALPDVLRHAYATGGDMHLVHAAAIAAAATAPRHMRLSPALILWGAGTILFSGSLYAYALTQIRAFALLTPVGGVILMAGWLALAWAGLRPQKDQRL